MQAWVHPLFPLQTLRACSYIFYLFGSLSLIFYSSGGLGGVVEQDAVDSRDFLYYPVNQVVDEVIGKVFHGYFHYIRSVDGADNAWPVKGTLAVFDTC